MAAEQDGISLPGWLTWHSAPCLQILYCDVCAIDMVTLHSTIAANSAAVFHERALFLRNRPTKSSSDGSQLAEVPLAVGKIGPHGQRPRFRLSTRQACLASYLPAIDAALQAIGEAPAWLQRRNRAAPFCGRAPLEWMTERDGEGAAEVLHFLSFAVLRRSLR
jgi:hypothetical protein